MKAAEENEAEGAGKTSPSNVTMYRAICARINYLALDRPDIQFAAKEASRKMSAPQAGDWRLVKRIGRYLKWKPRLAQLYAWQEWPDKIDQLVESRVVGVVGLVAIVVPLDDC